MKKLIFVQHALDRMKERGISEELVKETLIHPDNIDSKVRKIPIPDPPSRMALIFPRHPSILAERHNCTVAKH